MDELHRRCTDQINRYDRSHGADVVEDCCIEIVRKAAQGLYEALAALLELCTWLTSKRCPPELRERGLADDFSQEVNIKMLKKFQSTESPYQPITFAAFRAYLNTTMYRVKLDMMSELAKRDVNEKDIQPDIPDDEREESAPKKSRGAPERSKIESTHETHILVQNVLDFLTKPLDREIIVLRYKEGLSVDEVVDELKFIYPDLTKDMVYEIAANAILRIKRYYRKTGEFGV
jgi:RNA polymerase sigma factor (sigma-70 family)